MMNVKYTRADTARWLLVLDVAATIVLLASATALVWNAYASGQAAGTGAADAGRLALWNMLTSLAFFMGAFAWLFARFFKGRFAEINTPWA